MPLHRDNEEDLISGLHGLAASSLASEVFESLFELNGQCLELLAEQALAQGSQGNLLLRQVGEIWRTLDATARKRAAACPYLLVDVGFSDPVRWRSTDDRHVSEAAPASYGTFFTVPRTAAIAQQVFIYAWYLARSKNPAVQLLLGMSTHCTQLISASTLPQMHGLAEKHPEWLLPRWPNRVKVWRQLLLAAASGEVVALENARMHGLQLLASECRNAATQVPRAGGNGDRKI